MPPGYLWLIVAVNALTLLVALGGFVKWFRGWILKQIAEPLSELRKSVRTAGSDAKRAHVRIDRHLEAHSG